MSGYRRIDFIDSTKNTMCISKSEKKTVTKRRREYGKGTVERTSSRIKPFKAKVPVGTVEKNGRTQMVYKSLGNYPTRALAEEALSEYNRMPYDLENKIITFSDLYEAWSNEYFEKLTSASSIRTIENAYEYCKELYDMPIRKINVGHIKDAMSHGWVVVKNGKYKNERKVASLSTQERIKSMCNLMFDYAYEHNLVSKNPARAFKIPKIIEEIESNAKEKQPFSVEQVQSLWKYYRDIPYSDMLLIGIYTGLRPQELCSIRAANINIEGKFMVAGMKTKAGIDRIIPIHPEIMDLVVARYKQATEVYNSEYLFNIPDGGRCKCFTYDIYRHRFENVMSEMNFIGFTPHCTRVTFASQAEKCQLRNRAIKLCMGHSLRNDVTEMHYKKTDFDYLYNEICKLSFKMEDENYE